MTQHTNTARGIARKIKPKKEDSRGVSPVIGIILMVAITVILASVIGVFVLGIGDQIGETTPQASFSASAVDTASDGTISVDIEKTGGSDLTTSELVLAVDGDRYPDALSDTDVGDAWRTGEVAAVSDVGSDLGDTGEERVSLSIIHETSGDAVYQTTITVPEQPD